jgi:transcriptional regulator with GAF, ATPase, and Fis domain
VAVNCGALPGELLESELFGHVRGAFTGAVRDRNGRFELAKSGTIFLDEIGDMPLHLQVKLLRVLQEKTFERVGDSHSRSTDARIIAATNKDLPKAVLEGEFREDLYYRLRVVPISIPPLRNRREDIEPLIRHLFSRVSRRHDRAVILSPEAMRDLLSYDWPGNVRELENALEYAVAVSQTQTIHPQDLPLEITATNPLHQPAPPQTASVDHPRTQASAAATPEYERIRATLDQYQWRRAEAAEALGMSRTTLWRKMRELGLTR